jgi:hypothetical protein
VFDAAADDFPRWWPQRLRPRREKAQRLRPRRRKEVWDAGGDRLVSGRHGA